MSCRLRRNEDRSDVSVAVPTGGQHHAERGSHLNKLIPAVASLTPDRQALTGEDKIPP